MLWSFPGGQPMSAVSSIEVASCGGPTVPLCPAPWKLRGNGLIVVARTPLGTLQADPAISADIRKTLKAPLNLLMLVNYAQSDCGPYQELLFVPGTAAFGERRLPTISNIFVSSEASVVNGRLNWGIPKHRCHFDWPSSPMDDADGSTHLITASRDDTPFFRLRYSADGLKLPVNTRWIPNLFKTLGQDWEGRRFIFSPSAKGHARRAKIHDLHVAPGVFPVLSAQQVLMAFEITDFEMEFPVPQIL